HCLARRVLLASLVLRRLAAVDTGYVVSVFLRLRPPPGSTLFPYTTLFRSICSWKCPVGLVEAVQHGLPAAVIQFEDGSDAGCPADRKSTRLNSSHVEMSYAVFCLKKKTCRPAPQGRRQARSTGGPGPPRPY